MFYLRFILCAALSVLPVSFVAAAAVHYQFQANVTNEFGSPQRFFSTDDLIEGAFTYDSDVVEFEDGDPSIAVYPQTLTNLSGSILGNSFSDAIGGGAVFNDTHDNTPGDPNDPLQDMLILFAEVVGFEESDIDGFQVISNGTTYELVNVRFFWMETTNDFLPSDELPGVLPRNTDISRMALDFADITNSGNMHSVFAESLVISEVPLPAAGWLFLSALIGVSGLKYKK